MRTPPRGPFAPGDQVQLTDPKGRQHRLVLTAGKSFHTHRGALSHDDLIGKPEGSVVLSAGGTAYIALRPLLADYALSMPRGAAVIYPKDAAQIVGLADIFPGARVVEAGAGSGALSCWLLRAVGESGRLTSFERRPDFAEIAAANVRQYFGGAHPAWQLVVADLDPADLNDADRVVLDMLAPWEHAQSAADMLIPGGLVCCYVATTTQLARTVGALRDQGNFAEPAAWETMQRGWHVDGLAVRPEHRMVGHTGFLITARRLADGVTPPPRRRRPSKGAEALLAESGLADSGLAEGELAGIGLADGGPTASAAAQPWQPGAGSLTAPDGAGEGVTN
ncbi:MAG TPA: tRNA (adenine-N1)-methyltransferase [Streptosporangiaceae bacterium]|nr:tRNA (adenine-N1)-methyltransferase [Streptosporangiaceae bacterium]